MSHLTPVSRAAALLAAGALVLAAAPAQAGVVASPAQSAGDWLTAQAPSGLVHNDQYDFDDYGLTADVALGLVALGRADDADPMATALADHVDDWTTYKRQVYAGSVAKAVVLAQETGNDPRTYGGVDLVRRLNARVSNDKPTVGRIEDRSRTDYANVIGQALAARALGVAGSGKADEVRRYLLLQQCSKGWFRLNLPGKAKKDQSCDAGSPTGISAPDTDVTALAVLSLRATPHKTKRVRSAIKDAVGWLERTQKKNGSFGGGTSTEKSNTNSTGLAGWALGEAGSCDAALAAATWVSGLQVAPGQPAPLDTEGGAIAYDRAAYTEAQAAGITAETRDQWRRASAQAAPALPYLDVAACQG